MTKPCTFFNNLRHDPSSWLQVYSKKRTVLKLRETPRSLRYNDLFPTLHLMKEICRKLFGNSFTFNLGVRDTFDKVRSSKLGHCFPIFRKTALVANLRGRIMFRTCSERMYLFSKRCRILPFIANLQSLRFTCCHRYLSLTRLLKCRHTLEAEQINY